MRKFVVSMSILLLSAIALAQAPQNSEVSVVTTEAFGDVLAGPDGRSLYFSLNDRGEISSCSPVCARNWTPFLTNGEPVAEEGVNADFLTTAQQEDGSFQVMYNGRLLYFFNADEAPGDTGGQGSGAVWFLMTPEGEAAAARPAESAATDEVVAAGDGVFTAEQAQAGRSAYQRSCAVCHQESLMGEQYAPPLTGAQYERRWNERTVGDLFHYTRDNMPLGAGHSLEDEAYLAITAYILQFNGAAAGTEALTLDSDALENAVIGNLPLEGE